MLPISRSESRRSREGTYTADAVALLMYLVDGLPGCADRLFAEAEAGETVIQAPTTAIAEVRYSVSRDRNVRGVRLTGSPERARQALLADGPVSVAPVAEEELAEHVRVVGESTIHDALVVASHRGRETVAVITTDGGIRDPGIPTVWE